MRDDQVKALVAATLVGSLVQQGTPHKRVFEVAVQQAEEILALCKVKK